MERLFVLKEWQDFPGPNAKAYRIWKKQTDHGWLQRHEWLMNNGCKKPEPWIATPFEADDQYVEAA